MNDNYEYHGKEFDPISGLDTYDFHARAYHPDKSVFGSPDILAVKTSQISSLKIQLSL